MKEHIVGGMELVLAHHSSRLLGWIFLSIILTTSPNVDAAGVSVDPDDFPTGTDISDTFSGVTLSVVGTQVDSGYYLPQVFSISTESATTGTRLFGNKEAISGVFTQGWNEEIQMLRVDFDAPVELVAIDIVGRGGAVGVVRAFDAAGAEVGAYTTAPLQSLDTFEVASVAASTGDIAYALVYGERLPDGQRTSVRLDNLRYEPVPVLIVNIEDGTPQECSEVEGATVRVQASIVPALDQYKGEPGSANGPEVRSDRVWAQTVTAGISGTLAKIEAWNGLPTFRPTEDLTVSIYSVTDGVPYEELSSVNLAPDEVGRSGSDLTTVDFSLANLSFSAGEQFAIVMRSQQTLPSYYNWWGNPSPGQIYLDGAAFVSLDDGITWLQTQNSDFDFFFWTYMVAAGDQIAAVEWQVDDVTAGFGNPAAIPTPLGPHQITALATTQSGASIKASSALTIRDATAPLLSLWLSDRQGNPIVEFRQTGLNAARVNYDVTDVCDPSPVVSVLAGTPVADGQMLIFNTSTNKAVIDALGFTVKAEAVDASGNSASQEIVLFPE